jgi:hypothetical protein
MGLLELKRARPCAPGSTPVGDSDLVILAKIEASRSALAAHTISDLDQMHQQTQLLDEFDGLLPPIEPVASALESAAGFTRLTAPQDEGEVKTYDDILWYPDVNALASTRDYTSHKNPALRGRLVLSERSLSLLSRAPDGSQSGFGRRIPFSDVASVEIVTFGMNAVVVVRQRSGRLDSFHVGGALNRSRTSAIGKALQSRVRPQAATAAEVQANAVSDTAPSSTTTKQD